jgi:apolipoprotein D and lipocalin family protein
MPVTAKSKKFIKYFSIVFVISLLTSCLDTVPYVDLKRYSGLWYEIASYPSDFNQGLVGTNATYEVLGDGTVSVYNRAYIGKCDGEETSITGYAIAEDETNSKLSVNLEVRPGVFSEGQYWIIALDPKNYSFAVVSEPTMQNLFILSREPTMDKKLLKTIITALVLAGFEQDKIQLTPQCG